MIFNYYYNFATMNESFIYMNRCLELAKLGEGGVSPNPIVGAVLVYKNRIIGEGFHQKYGKEHAEVNCINSVQNEDKPYIEDATLYVSLEPCSHFGKTPPCVDLILKNKIKKVVIACRDISAKVNGQGVEKLRSNGVEVLEDILKNEATELNSSFFYYEKFKRPYIILKWAQSNDFFISKKNQQIKISNQYTDRVSHRWRANVDAIFVGYQTAIVDNPKLNVRLAQGTNPIRIVFDKDISLPKTSQIFNPNEKCIVLNFKENKLIDNIEYIKISRTNPYPEMIQYLFERNIQSLLVEGGAVTLQSFIDNDLWNEARIITSSMNLNDGVASPVLKNYVESTKENIFGDIIQYYKNSNISI